MNCKTYLGIGVSLAVSVGCGWLYYGVTKMQSSGPVMLDEATQVLVPRDPVAYKEGLTWTSRGVSLIASACTAYATFSLLEVLDQSMSRSLRVHT